MKQIEPIQSWVKGQKVIATILNVRPIGGELFKFARFYYALLDENMVVCADGNINMEGEAYQEWGNDDEYTYNWAASKDILDLIIIGDYVSPVQKVVIEAPIEENLDSVI